jgi:hypothetical protein
MSTQQLTPVAAPVSPQPPRLLDQLRALALARFGRPEPAERYVGWARRFVLFHGKRHPRALGLAEVAYFLDHLAQTEKDPLRCLEQAREALSFLYEQLLHIPLGELPFPEPPRLLDRLRRAARLRHYSPRTEDCYAEWAERYIRFHGLRHPATMGAAKIEMFLTDLAVRGHVSASTQNQAFNALLFLYRQVLGVELPRVDAVRARRPRRLPTVLGDVSPLCRHSICGTGAIFPPQPLAPQHPPHHANNMAQGNYLAQGHPHAPLRNFAWRTASSQGGLGLGVNWTTLTRVARWPPGSAP